MGCHISKYPMLRSASICLAVRKNISNQIIDTLHRKKNQCLYFYWNLLMPIYATVIRQIFFYQCVRLRKCFVLELGWKTWESNNFPNHTADTSGNICISPSLSKMKNLKDYRWQINKSCNLSRFFGMRKEYFSKKIHATPH